MQEDEQTRSVMVKFTLRHRIISALQDVDIRGIRKIAYFLPKILIPKPKSSVIIKTLYGFKLRIDPVYDDGVEESIYYTGTYEKGTLYVIKKILNKGDLFIDVGANIGLMSIYASSLVSDTGRVVAFEPNPATMGILKSNIELNSISNIETSDYAIGNTEQASKIYERKDLNRGCASLIKTENEAVIYDIHIIPLSQYFITKERIGLIKIDIEGYELAALEGAKEILTGDTPPKLIVECSEMRENTHGFNTDDLYEFLIGLKQYRLFKSKSGKGKVSKLLEILKLSDMPQHDNIYCFTNNHLEAIPGNIFINERN